MSQRKQRDVLWFVLSQIDRKPVTDEEARKNYKEAIWDYIIDLETLEPINVLPISSAYEQKQYLNKLNILTDRWIGIGNDTIPQNTLEDFLVKLQDMCRNYLYQDLDLEFKRLRQIHYTQLAFNRNQEVEVPNRLEQLKREALPKINGLG